MDVSVWWVLIAAMIGLFAGIGLFAILTMASDHDGEGFPEAGGPAHTVS